MGKIADNAKSFIIYNFIEPSTMRDGMDSVIDRESSVLNSYFNDIDEEMKKRFEKVDYSDYWRYKISFRNDKGTYVDTKINRSWMPFFDRIHLLTS
jgi:hypothetical protein